MNTLYAILLGIKLKWYSISQENEVISCCAMKYEKAVRSIASMKIFSFAQNGGINSIMFVSRKYI